LLFAVWLLLYTTQEFNINGSTPEEQAARAEKAAERRARIIVSMQEDAQQLKEMRWPYVSSRAPVQPTQPPHQQQLDSMVRPHSAGPQVGATLAAQLRAEVTKQPMASGKFDTRDERCVVSAVCGGVVCAFATAQA
jgi:hypothetical protein